MKKVKLMTIGFVTVTLLVWLVALTFMTLVIQSDQCDKVLVKNNVGYRYAYGFAVESFSPPEGIELNIENLGCHNWHIAKGIATRAEQSRQ